MGAPIPSSDTFPPLANPTFKVSKSGFKAMKIIKNTPKLGSASPNTQSSSFFDSINSNDMDSAMVGIESYIAQQNEASSSNNYNRDLPLPSDMSPDPSTPIDLVENDSSPEPQRNSNFHVVKKTKPKRSKNKKKNKKMKVMMEMEPEDCTIRHDEDTTVGNKIAKTLASMRMSPKPDSKPTNPFDMLDENEESIG